MNFKRSSLFVFVLIFAMILPAILTACVKETKFLVVFEVDDLIYDSVTTAGNEIITMPSNPVKEDHVFVGWFLDKGTWEKEFKKDSLLDVILEADINVYAKFISVAEHETSQSFTVAFDSMGGSDVDNAVVKWGELVEEPNAPDKPGFVFLGWYISVDNYAWEFDFNTSIVEDITLNAKWEVYSDLKHLLWKDNSSLFSEIWGDSLTLGIDLDAPYITDSYQEMGTKVLMAGRVPLAIEFASLEDLNQSKDMLDVAVRSALDNSALTSLAFEKLADYNILTLNYVGLPYILTGNVKTENNAYVDTEVDYLIKYTGNQEEYTLSSGLSSIGEHAFSNCTSLTSVVIPDSVSKIGVAAFYGCLNISSLEVRGGSLSIEPLTFSNCSALESITIPSSVTSIGMAAFKNCTSLESIIIPDSVLNIGKGAFEGCSSLESIILFENLTHIREEAFKGCGSLTSLTIPSSLTNMGFNALNGCNNLTSLSIPFVGSILNGASSPYFGYIFGGTSANDNYYVVPASLKEVEITGSGEIGSKAFSKCQNLLSVKIGEQVPSLSGDVFFECTSLASVEIGKGVTSIGSNAFIGCLTLKEVEIKDLEAWLAIEFENNFSNPLSYARNLYLDEELVTEFVLSEGISSISPYAFYACESLISVLLPSSISRIGKEAFSQCLNLTIYFSRENITGVETGYDWNASNCPLYYGVNENTLTKIDDVHYYLSDDKKVIVTSFEYGLRGGIISPYASFGGESYSVTAIGDFAFSNSTSLTSILIPDTITEIGSYAFRNCTSLSVYFASENPLTSITLGEHWKPAECPFYTRANENTFRVFQGIHYYLWGDEVLVTGYEYGLEDAQILESVTMNGLSYPVTTIERYAFYGCDSLSIITIPETISRVRELAFHNTAWFDNQEGGLIYAGSALYTYKGVMFENAEISLREDTTVIAEGAFMDRPLSSIVFPESLLYIGANAFRSCGNLSSLTFNEKLESIAASAFYSCLSLTSVTLPSSVASMGLGAFQGCDGLTEITLPFVGSTLDGETNTHFGHIFGADFVSYNNSYVPSSLKSVVLTSGREIADQAFENCNKLTSILIPDSIISIGDSAFKNCNQLTSFLIPDSITTIGDSAFENCNQLTSIQIPDLVTTIGASAFEKCSNLTSIAIGESVTRIKDNAFLGCFALEEVTVDSLATWAEIDFTTVYSNPVFYSRALFLDGSLVTNLALPSEVTSIGPFAFYNCESLLQVTLPTSVQSIGVSAFEGCISITQMALPFVGSTLNGTENTHFGYIFGASDYYSNKNFVPSSLKSLKITGVVGGVKINDWAFFDCASFEGIEIGENVTTIGSSVFYSCTGLQEIIMGENVTSIGASAFSNCSNLNRVETTSIASWSAIEFEDPEANPIYHTKNLYYNDSVVYALVIPSFVESIGSFAFYNSTITSLEVGENVESIGSHAFFNCESLTSVVIGESVASIASNAFSNCTSLNKVEVKDIATWSEVKLANLNSNPLYHTSNLHLGETLLVNLVIPSGVENIDNYTFYNCSHLETIIIPSTVQSIGLGAFQGCTSLTSITLPFIGSTLGGETKTHFGYIFGADSTGYNNSFVPSSLKVVVLTGVDIEGGVVIDTNAFIGCRNLEEIEIGDFVTSIGGNAFWNCFALEELVIGQNVVSIGEEAFGHCFALTSVTLPTNLTTLGAHAFFDCQNLITIEIGNKLTSIPNSAFRNCHALSSIAIPSSATSIGANSFENCNSLTQVTIGENVTSIGDFAFLSCRNLASVIIPNSVTIIGANAFKNCDSLTQATIGTSVASIGDSAFNACGNLASITIPNSVTIIGANAFLDCMKLVSIEIGNRVVSIGNFAFSSCASLNEVKVDDISTWLAIEFGNAGSNPLIHTKILTIDGVKTTALDLPSGITEISNYAFYGYKDLTSIKIPESVVAIGERAFTDCSSLTLYFVGEDISEITLGDNWNSSECPKYFGINEDNFSIISGVHYYLTSEDVVTITGYDAGITSIDIPSSVEFAETPYDVTEIGKAALRGCASLTAIFIPTEVFTVETHAFTDCLRLSIYFLKESSVGIFLKTDWNKTACPVYYAVEKGVNFEIMDENGLHCLLESDEVKITGYDPGKSPLNGNYKIPENVPFDGWGKKVTSIEPSALRGCEEITSLEIEENVKSIGTQAFAHCANLTTVTIGENVTSIGAHAFANCSSLVSVIMGESMTNIYSRAFEGCESLERVEISDIGLWLAITFENFRANPLHCSADLYIGSEKLTDLVIPSNVTKINDFAFYNYLSLISVSMGEDVIAIGNHVFYNCVNLEELIIGENVESIGTSAFCDCHNLTSVEGWKNVTTVGNYAFYACYSLEEITIGESLTTISESMFAFSGLTSIVLGGQVKNIGNNAFQGCHSLASVTMEESVENIGSQSFYDCVNLTYLEIGENVTYIGHHAFYNCINLEEIEIGEEGIIDIRSNAFHATKWYDTHPDGIMYLGPILYAYKGAMPENTSLIIDEDTLAIADSAFYECQNLTTIVFNASLSSIGAHAFYNCNNLLSVVISDNVLNIETHAFDIFYGKLTLYTSATPPKPAGWEENWISTYRPIIWNCELSEDSSYVISFEKTPDSPSSPRIGTINGPFRLGYTFLGWATSPESQEVAYEANDIGDAINGTTLYAIWLEE